jgi:sec-independent protein translocase protein TatA
MPANLRGWEILVILLLIVLLFGAKRLPDAARGLGRSLRIFKAETKGLAEEQAEERAEVRAAEEIEAIETVESAEESTPHRPDN